MFESSSTPLLLSEARVQVLRLSLNAPVLNIEQLPVGPGEAAILLYAEEYGGLRLAIGVRSKGSGTSIQFRHAGEEKELRKPEVAMNAALSFAEGMGFLFDEDLVRSDGKAAALVQWEKLTGEGEGSVPAAAQQDEALELGEGDELLLDDVEGDLGADLAEGPDSLVGEPLDVLDSSSDLLADLDGPPKETPATGEYRASAASDPNESSWSDPDPHAESGSATLSKFRRRAGDRHSTERRAAPESKQVDDSAPGTPGNALGRIALVRRRVDTEGPEKPNALLRIVGHF